MRKEQEMGPGQGDTLVILGNNALLNYMDSSIHSRSITSSVLEKNWKYQGISLHFQTCKNHTNGNFYNKYF